MGLKSTYQARKRFTRTPVKSTGMWYQDKDVVVPSNRITMKGPQGQPDYFKEPILGVGMQSGQTQVMQPGREYSFPNDQSVYETKMQYGGHAVRPGETFFGIANKYDLTRQQLTQANPNLNIDKISVNQRIALPQRYEGQELIPGYFETKDKSIFGTVGKQYRQPSSNSKSLVKKTTEVGLTPDILRRQAFAESTFNPKAKSSAGYMGLGQIGNDVISDYKKATGASKVDPYNPVQNAQVQKWAMNQIYNAEFVNKPGQDPQVRLAKTLASYNWGKGNVRKYLTKQKKKGVDIYNSLDWVEDLPKETRDYIHKIQLGDLDSFNKEYNTAVKQKKYQPYVNLYQKGGETSTEDNPVRMNPVYITAKKRNQDFISNQDNTRIQNQIVPREFRGRRYVQPTLSEYVEPSIGNRILNTLASPMTALNNNRTGSRNPFDYALDMVNPFSWVESGKRAVGSLAEGEYTDAALNALGALPVVPATIANAKNITKAVNKIPAKINPRYFKPNENLWYRQVGKSAIDDIAESKVIRERGEDILNSKKVYDNRVLRMQGIDPDTGKPFPNYEIAARERVLASRRPASPYFQKGELYWGLDRKPKKLGKGRPGRGGDADSEYLIESLLGDNAIHPAYIKGLSPDIPEKFVGDIGILKPIPEFRDPTNFNIYKRNWWSGYKPIKKYGDQLNSYQNGGLFPVGPYDEMMAPKEGNYLLPDINRPSYVDNQGYTRSEYKMGFNIDGKETLLPTVVDGRQLSPDQAIDNYYRTGLHMGQYDSPQQADYRARLRTAKYNMLKDPARFNINDF